MAYVRFKLSDDTHRILKKVCSRLGMKESEIARIALIEYMKSLSVLSHEVKKHRKFRI